MIYDRWFMFSDVVIKLYKMVDRGFMFSAVVIKLYNKPSGVRMEWQGFWIIIFIAMGSFLLNFSKRLKSNSAKLT